MVARCDRRKTSPFVTLGVDGRQHKVHIRIMKTYRNIKHTSEKLLGEIGTAKGFVRVYETRFVLSEVIFDEQLGETRHTRYETISLIETPDGQTHGIGKFADGLVSAWKEQGVSR